MVSAEALMARPISPGLASRDCTIQSAIRSALRGPIPGMRFSSAIKAWSAIGYPAALTVQNSIPRCMTRSLRDRLATLQGIQSKLRVVEVERRQACAQLLDSADVKLNRPVGTIC